MTTGVKDASHVIGVGDNLDVDLHLIGNQLYVRKCLNGAQYGDDPNLRHIGGILLPRNSDKIWSEDSETSNWVEILGWGPKCKYKWVVGALAHKSGHVKSLDPRVKRSPYCSFEFFISEALDNYGLPIFDLAYDPDYYQ